MNFASKAESRRHTALSTALSTERLTLAEFYGLTRQNMADRPNWRYGQALFNSLLSIRPDLAERIRGTEIDPFTVNVEHDRRLEKFTQFLQENWK